jgi:Predicted O-methyltransferase
MQNKQQSLINLRLPAGIDVLDRVTEGYQLYQTLIAALDLGLFELLTKEGPLEREKIAQGIGINGIFSRCFLGTLVDIGVISLQDGKYYNSTLASDFLVSSSPFYQGDRIRNAQGHYWSNLVASLKRQQHEMNSFAAGPGEPFLNSLAQGSLRGELQAVATAVLGWNGFSKAQTLLDVGGGHGLYTIALCQANTHLNGVVFDKPHVIDVTQRNIMHYGMENRISALAGDVCTDNFGSGYDIVLISHVLYKFRKNLDPIFDKVFKSLNPGGLLVTNHWFCATGCVAESSSVKELAKSLQSFGHPLCHLDDFNELFKKKGFKVIQNSYVPSVYGNSTLHLAIKEGSSEESSNQTCC